MSNIRQKNRQSSHNKAYYKDFRARYSGKLIRRKARREKQVEFFAAFPEQGSPSQLRLRPKYARQKEKREKRKHRNETYPMESKQRVPAGAGGLYAQRRSR